MTDTPLLSVCVPTFNRRQLLERNVSFHLEAFGARGIPFEIVIADDGSSDGTAEYLASLAGETRVRSFRRARNSGFLDNYAFTMRRARGRWAVFLGDDDLLIPDRIADNLARLEGEPSVGMLQAPWLLVDERPGGRGPIGPFYRIPGERRFARGDFKDFLGFVFDHHVFPEFMMIRNDVLRGAISSACPFIFWAYLYSARALAKADAIFVPEPFARVTAASADPRLQQGNTEAMFQWDRYRGGIEYLASLAHPGDRWPMAERGDLGRRIDAFMHNRQGVALKLHVGAKNWPEAYILHHRMAAYGASPLTAEAAANMARAAGIATAAAEAASYGAGPVLLDPAFDDGLVGLLKPEVQARLSRDVPPERIGAEPTAWLRIDPRFPARVGPQDAVFDVEEYVAQYV